MYGPGEDFMKWNNTGVSQDFACTKGKVHVPEGKKAVITSGNWKVFSVSNSTFLVIYSDKELGIMVITHADLAEKVLDQVLKNNQNTKLLETQFHHPNGNFLEYDLDSSKDTWVIKSVNKTPVDRQFSNWPFFNGNIEETLQK